MIKVVGLAFVGGLLIGLFLGMMLMCLLIAGHEEEEEPIFEKVYSNGKPKIEIDKGVDKEW